MTIKVFCYTHASIHFVNVKMVDSELFNLNLMLTLLEYICLFVCFFGGVLLFSHSDLHPVV